MMKVKVVAVLIDEDMDNAYTEDEIRKEITRVLTKELYLRAESIEITRIQ